MARQPPLPLRRVARARPRRPRHRGGGACGVRRCLSRRRAACGRARKMFKTLRVSNINSNYYDNIDERYTTSNDLTTLTSSRPVRTINRPVGQEVGRFDLRNLKRGTYAWSLGDERRTIGAGTLVQPCPELSGMTPNDSLTRCTLSARRARQLLSRQQRNPTGNLRPTP